MITSPSPSPGADSRATFDLAQWQRDRAAVVKELDRFDALLARRAQTNPEPLTAEHASAWLRSRLLGGEGCVITAFDERLPDWQKALDTSKEAVL